MRSKYVITGLLVIASLVSLIEAPSSEAWGWFLFVAVLSL